LDGKKNASKSSLQTFRERESRRWPQTTLMKHEGIVDLPEHVKALSDKAALRKNDAMLGLTRTKPRKHKNIAGLTTPDQKYKSKQKQNEKIDFIVNVIENPIGKNNASG
jgi:hypothetical protein